MSSVTAESGVTRQSRRRSASNTATPTCHRAVPSSRPSPAPPASTQSTSPTRRGRPLRLRRLRRAGHARGWTLRKRRRHLAFCRRLRGQRRRDGGWLSPSALGNGPTSSSKVASHDFSDPSRPAPPRSDRRAAAAPRTTSTSRRFPVRPADRRDSLELERRGDATRRQPRPRRGRRPRTALVDRPRTP